MKNLLNVSKRSLTALAAAGMLCVLTLSSCLKTNDNNATPQQPVALLSVIQAVPDAPPVDFYLGGNRVNLAPLSYNTRIDYFRAATGSRAATFYSTGTSTVLFSDSVQLAENQVYSLFVSNTTASPKFLLLTDAIVKPQSASGATLRFVNVSPDAGPVDLVVQGGSTVATNLGYNQATDFNPIAANQTYTFQIVKSGTSTVLATLSKVTLNAGSVYTIWVHGFAAATDAKKIAADALLNAYY